jgi:regulator of PEP synthase PpsR (kinase-PPPase family)
MAISDSTGETAEQCCRAALAQFGAFPEGTVRVVSHVLDEETLDRCLADAASHGAIVAYTLVGRGLRNRVQELADRHDVVTHDLLGALIGRLATQLGRGAKNVPGLGHELDAEYFRRIEAIEFAVYNDDGKVPSNLKKADIVLIGISRTSKTPLSNYLAQRGYKVANVPFVPEVPLPAELASIDPRRVFGLMIDAVTLMNIRKARMKALGMSPDAGYGDLRQIRREITHAHQLFDMHPEWTVVDVSQRAIEETATTILEAYRDRFEPSDDSPVAPALPPVVAAAQAQAPPRSARKPDAKAAARKKAAKTPSPKASQKPPSKSAKKAAKKGAAQRKGRRA